MPGPERNQPYRVCEVALTANLEDTIRILHYCLLVGGTLFIVGLENRYPLTETSDLKSRMNHGLSNLGLWLITVLCVDIGLQAYLTQLPTLVHFSERGFLSGLGLPTVWLIVLSLLILDFVSYIVHSLMHKLPWLWIFHSVHHSDPSLDISTSFRFHPVEALIGLLWVTTLVIAMGMPLWIAPLRALVILPLSLMHHANIAIPDSIERMLRLVLVSPALHKIHHSPRQSETDSNYGLFLSIWDRMFGTLCQVGASDGPRYGLDFLGEKKWQSVWGMLRTPWSAQFKRAQA